MEWLDKLKEYAPDIAMAVVSGGATLPSLAVKAVNDALDTDLQNETDLQSYVMNADPDAMLKLKQANNAFKIRMRELDVELEQAELKDMQQARDKHEHSMMPAIICIALTLMVAIGADLLFNKVLPEENKEIAYLLFGALLSKWGDSIAYWVGTTRSSATKTFMLKQ